MHRKRRYSGAKAPAPAYLPGIASVARLCVRVSLATMRTKKFEGVEYHPFLVRFTTNDGKRRRMKVWSPNEAFLGEIVRRELDGRGDVDASKQIYVRSHP